MLRLSTPITIIMLLISNISFAQNDKISLWNDKQIPNYKPADESEQADTTNIVRISKVQKSEIEIFLPAKKNATGQAVVICPGGGYAILAYDWEGTDIAKWLNSLGIAGIVLKYRLPRSKSNIIGHKSPLLDAQRAIRFTRHHAGEWNIAPDKIGIMGFSAGGHLASTAGTHFDTGDPNAEDTIERYSSRPDFMILGYPVITFTDAVMHKGSRANLLGDEVENKELQEYYSNELQVTKETPPTFLFHAGDDTGVPVKNSLLFYEALVNHSVPAEMHIYPKGGHGFSLAINNKHLSLWTTHCAAWLQWLKNQ